MNILSILLLLTAFGLTRVKKLFTAVHVITIQSVIVALACMMAGFGTGEMHMYIAAFLTILVKVLFIPIALYRLVKRLKHEKETVSQAKINQSSLIASLFVIFVYGLIDRTMPGMISRDAVVSSIVLILIGLLVIVARRQAIMEIVGLITMENGLYLLGLSINEGLPLIIEFGIFFDVLVAVIVLVILTYRLKLSFMTTDTAVLRKLKG